METTVKERPIFLPDADIKRIRHGLKTQARFIVKIQPELNTSAFPGPRSWWYRPSGSSWLFDDEPSAVAVGSCPYGRPGDRLYVKEASFYCNGSQEYVYAADGKKLASRVGCMNPEALKWLPAIQMPRKAARIVLELTEVRLERLRDISDYDAAREGCRVDEMRSGDRLASVFARHWDAEHGHKAWDENLWAWALTFKEVSK